MATRKTSIKPTHFPIPKPPEICVLVLAAGEGKRMHSRTSKVVHPLAGKPMVRYVVDAALAMGASRILVVVGSKGEDVKEAVGTQDRRIVFCVQDRPLGTGHAVLCAEKALKGVEGTLLILNGDLPSLRGDTLRHLFRTHRESGASLTLITAVLEDPGNYGRIVRNYNSDVSRIVEATDATSDQKQIKEVNAGIYCVEIEDLFRHLKQAATSNAQGEVYLTDLVELLKKSHRKVTAYAHSEAEEVLGVNNRRELARAGKTLYLRKATELMEGGVSILDPGSTYVEAGVKVGRDTLLSPHTFLEGETVIGEGCRIAQGTRIINSTLAEGVEVLDHCVINGARLGRGVRVGPFAHLRPGTDLADEVRIGNFVETKESRIGRGSKANHLAYLGDSEIGAGVNVGAGTITCNYDGEKKHKTILEDEVFIGSDSQLVAPVKVKRGAYVGAGSTITKDVPAYSLAIARGRQVVVEGWAKKKHGREKRSRE
ncbi:MAG TPA: bifunctional UDP-N-acetylglucosamine diphosphorylase/glucosamine-1-phosphate N-acetyltransferase GlmU [Candidatus Polarisedimenticolia bacterium]|nr:bifunctional UDP-N-acetylglucosamine diphosphorylase/glucosamine-1-phosphate N-acetyltransferase GlmU [Candidatus Polarisedimenticolia bacterium]